MPRRSAPPPVRRSYRPSQRPPSLVPAVIAALIWAAVAALVYRVDNRWPYLAWLAGGTVATALLFAFDKAQSKTPSARRVPEVVLLSLSLLGGVIGGWIGMLVLRHKTRHPNFWAVQWIATVLHVGIAWWLLGNPGN